jgi:hypothetical protein
MKESLKSLKGIINLKRKKSLEGFLILKSCLLSEAIPNLLKKLIAKSVATNCKINCKSL